MKLSLLFVIGVVAVLAAEFCTVNLQRIGVWKHKNKTWNGSSAAKTKNPLLPEELRAIHEKAKRISYSKPSIINIKGKEPEYRRSLIRKLDLKLKSHSLRKIVSHLKNVSEAEIIPSLQSLEFMLHQYDIAIEFMKIGGMDLLIPLIQLDDDEIASVTLSALSAAMQGNPVVQKIAVENNVLDVLLANLANKNRNHLHSILYALSSCLRNMPDTQMSFFHRGGISLLADVIKEYKNTMKFRLHAVSIFADLAFEIFDDTETNHQKLKLQKEFTNEIQATDVCREVTLFLECDEVHISQRIFRMEYMIHEKIIFAMDGLHIACARDFQTKNVKNLFNKLLNKYDPRSELPWYSEIDKKFKYLVYFDIVRLLSKIYSKEFLRKDEL